MNNFQPTCPREHRITRLELAHFKLHRIFLRFADIRRIRNHKVERSRRKSVQQIAEVDDHEFPDTSPVSERIAAAVGERIAAELAG